MHDLPDRQPRPSGFVVASKPPAALRALQRGRLSVDVPVADVMERQLSIGRARVQLRLHRVASAQRAETVLTSRRRPPHELMRCSIQRVKRRPSVPPARTPRVGRRGQRLRWNLAAERKTVHFWHVGRTCARNTLQFGKRFWWQSTLRQPPVLCSLRYSRSRPAVRGQAPGQWTLSAASAAYRPKCSSSLARVTSASRQCSGSGKSRHRPVRPSTEEA